MNIKMLDSIEITPEMDKMVIEALMTKRDYTSLYATKLIIEQKTQLARYKATVTELDEKSGHIS